MLVQLRMSIKDSEKEFRRLSKSVFAASWTKPAVFRGINNVVGRPWFSANILKKAMENLLNDRHLSRDEPMKESDNPKCKV